MISHVFRNHFNHKTFFEQRAMPQDGDARDGILA
jgi:hypothetical protein